MLLNDEMLTRKIMPNDHDTARGYIIIETRAGPLVSHAMYVGKQQFR